MRLKNRSELYVTKFGMPFLENLLPENFLTDKEWFDNNSISLSGTSCLYKIRTKTVKGQFLDIVLKWNRMGQDVIGAEDSDELLYADFNSPFEEISLAMSLRDSVYMGPLKIIIQKPLAIYVAYEKVKLERLGRKEYKMQRLINMHKDIFLDKNRQYAVIYEWIKGIDAAQACKEKIISEELMKDLTLDAENRLEKKGFLVQDRKPHHIIINLKNDALIRDRWGSIIYGLVDYELLKRTQEGEKKYKQDKRINYLKRLPDRFKSRPGILHPHLHHVNIFGIDYIYGHSDTTKGALWVIGKDPYLFDYFLPERWEETPKVKMSLYQERYYTLTKDNIHLVWKISRVGLKPDMDPAKENEKKILDYGYNSPFEEVEIALKLSRNKIPTIYPRAIYMSSANTEIPVNLSDKKRYKTHKKYLTPDGQPILKKNHDYVIIWGYWNGPDEKLADKDGDYYEGINLLTAFREGIIKEKEYLQLTNQVKVKLAEVGIEDLDFRGSHLLISVNSSGTIVRDDKGLPEVRITNFEFLKKISK